MRPNNKNIQQAKLAAQRLYKKVNFDGGNLQTYQISSLLQQTYDFLKIPFKPTANDLKQYARVLDANGDGSVSLQDFETMAVNYLCGQGVLSQTTNKKSVGFADNQYSSSQNTSSNRENQSFSNNINSQYTSNRPSFNQQQQQQQQYINSANINNSNYQSYESGSGYEATSNVGGNYNSYQSYTSSQHLASKQYNNPIAAQQAQQQPRSRYTPVAQNYLSITRGLFNKYCNPTSNTITRDRVAVLLTQTYGALGRKGYYPSQEDVNVWMKLCDTNSDGHVQESEYEYFVIRALERSGIQVNNA